METGSNLYPGLDIRFIFIFTKSWLLFLWKFSEGFCNFCSRAMLGLGTHDGHVSLMVFELCSVSQFMIFMSLVGVVTGCG